MAEQHCRHPYEEVDIARLDSSFASLLAYAARPDERNPEGSAPAEALTPRERQLFRFGMFVGLGEWGMAGETICSMVNESTLSGSEAEHALIESTLVKGLMVSIHLRAHLAARGLSVPVDTLGAVKAFEASRETGPKSETGSEPQLNEREVFALGLGITWGSRCWDT